jgi:nucleoside-diphosphate-sugar epimerase
MKVFVAGGTGVLGRATVRALREVGHEVRTTARGAENAQLARRLGAVPLEVDLYDAAAVRRAIAGSDAVLRLTTKIPSVTKMGRRGAWTETNRLRTVGAGILVNAAIMERIPVYVHESVVFVYADGGAEWLHENARTDDGGTTILRAALDGEEEAVRFSQAGGRGIALRFGGFYAGDAPSTRETVQLARRRMLPQIGPGTNYVSSIYVPDAGRAIAAALKIPAGTYNVCDDTPMPLREYMGVIVSTFGTPSPRRLPGTLGRLLFGELGRFFFRSRRVSNRRFKDVAGWKPEVPSGVRGGSRRGLTLLPGARRRPARTGAGAMALEGVCGFSGRLFIRHHEAGVSRLADRVR